ncbi:helix-turn-helix domain-containing protein [Streptomyces sp. NPDC056647]|uniref:helix-turn-helix domain-containing protein n=1 Tax=unclassified Streptomyces TaxID=2593676 RepID=UPI003683380B
MAQGPEKRADAQWTAAHADWPQSCTGRVPVTRQRAPDAGQEPADAVSSRYLSEHERIHIADRLGEKASVRAIAAELGGSSSTVSQEVHRNRKHFVPLAL